MPNWAEGNIRLRGKKENIINFIQNELVGVEEKITTCWDEDTLENGKPTCGHIERILHSVILESNCGGESLIIKRADNTGDCFYFRNSNRQFLFKEDKEFEIYFSEGKNLNKDTIIFIDDFNGGWDVDESYFKEKAIQYKIDIRIFVWELGMCWSAVDIFYRNGVCECDTKTYSDWMWDSPMPHYGG